MKQYIFSLLNLSPLKDVKQLVQDLYRFINKVLYNKYLIRYVT